MNFDTIIDRRGSACYKYDAQQMVYGRDDLLALWVADMDFAVSPQIQAAIAKRATHPIYGYNFRSAEFQEALVRWLQKRHAWKTAEHKLSVLPSLMTALAYCILSHSSPNDKILIQTPVYPPFHSSVKTQNRQLLTNALINENGNYSIDWEDFEAKIKAARIFILCNPHNPVGRVFTKDELARMAELCSKYRVIIFSDEIHADLVYAPHRHIPIASLAEDITLTGISPAKSFNLAGMATAALISQNAALIEPVEQLNRNLHTYMGNSFGLSTFTAAYAHSETWLEALIVYLRDNRDYLVEALAESLPKVIVSPIEGTYLAWLDFKAYGLEEKELMRILKEDCHLALNAGSAFAPEGDGFMRLNFACPRARLTEAISRLASVF